MQPGNESVFDLNTSWSITGQGKIIASKTIEVDDKKGTDTQNKIT